MKPIRQKVINIDRTNLTCMVLSSKGTKYPVKMDKYLADGIQIGDTAIVVKDNLAHEWIMTDYIINTEAWADIPMDQVTVDDEPDYSFNVDGEWL